MVDVVELDLGCRNGGIVVARDRCVSSGRGNIDILIKVPRYAPKTKSPKKSVFPEQAVRSGACATCSHGFRTQQLLTRSIAHSLPRMRECTHLIDGGENREDDVKPCVVERRQEPTADDKAEDRGGVHRHEEVRHQENAVGATVL